MHWMRDGVAPSIDDAIARASTVFAVPGTSSKRTWPSQASAARTSVISAPFPPHDLLDAGVQPGGNLDRRRTGGLPARERLHASEMRPGIGGVFRAAGCGRWPPGRVVLVRHVDRVSLTGSARRRPCAKHTRLPAALHLLGHGGDHARAP